MFDHYYKEFIYFRFHKKSHGWSIKIVIAMLLWIQLMKVQKEKIYKADHLRVLILLLSPNLNVWCKFYC